MIISHEHRFIFLKTRKTAGTSVEIALSEHCGSQDVITGVSPEDEVTRRELGFRSAQNHRVALRSWTSKDWIDAIRKRRAPHYTQHTRAEIVRKRSGDKIWRDYFKFCVERNPFDKAVSLYYWRTRHSVSKPSLVQFLTEVDRESLSNSHIYLIDGQVAVDRVIRYEALQDELDQVSARIGIPPLRLPQAKSSVRAERSHYGEIMSNEARTLIERACVKEIELLGYEF